MFFIPHVIFTYHLLNRPILKPVEVNIPFRELIFRDIRVIGSLTASPKETQDMLEFTVKHGIKVKTNIYHGLREIPKMVEEAHSGKLKGKSVVVIDSTQLETLDLA